MNHDVSKLTAKPADLYAFIDEYINSIDVTSERFRPAWKGRIDPQWNQKIRPASEEQIAELKRISGFAARGYEIPKEYLAFLRRMGQDDGGLISNYFDCYTDIRAIINYYQDQTGEEWFDENDEPRENQLLITIGAMTNEPDFCITLKEDGGHEVSGRHYTWSQKKATDYYAETFDKFIMQIVFHLYEQAKYQNTVFLSSCYNDIKETVQQYGDAKLMQMIRELAQSYGFQPSWCSDQWHYYGFKEKCCLIIHRDFAYCGFIAAENLDDIGNIEEEINGLIKTHTEK